MGRINEKTDEAAKAKEQEEKRNKCKPDYSERDRKVPSELNQETKKVALYCEKIMNINLAIWSSCSFTIYVLESTDPAPLVFAHATDHVGATAIFFDKTFAFGALVHIEILES